MHFALVLQMGNSVYALTASCRYTIEQMDQAGEVPSSVGILSQSFWLDVVGNGQCKSLEDVMMRKKCSDLTRDGKWQLFESEPKITQKKMLSGCWWFVQF